MTDTRVVLMITNEMWLAHESCVKDDAVGALIGWLALADDSWTCDECHGPLTAPPRHWDGNQWLEADGTPVKWPTRS